MMPARMVPAVSDGAMRDWAEALKGPARTHALTVMAPLGPRRYWWCRLKLPVLRIVAMSSPLARLRFIHFAGCFVFSDLEGPRPPGWRPRPSMLFLADHDGDPAEYLAAFGLVVERGMQWIFGSTEAFPGPRPTRGLIQYVEERESVELVRYSAYPNATVRDIDTAIEADRRLTDLAQLGPDADEQELTERYEDLLKALCIAPDPRPKSFWSVLWQAIVGRSSVSELTVVAPLAEDGRDEAIAAIQALDGDAASPFNHVDGLHYARLAILLVVGRPARRRRSARSAPDSAVAARPVEHLVFSAWHDGTSSEFLDRLLTGQDGAADRIWGGCAGYPSGGDSALVARWLMQHRIRASLVLGSRRGMTVGQIQQMLSQRDRVLDVVTAKAGEPLSEILRCVSAVRDPRV